MRRTLDTVKTKELHQTAVVLRHHSYQFSSDEGSCCDFPLEIIVVNFLHFMLLMSKVFINHSNIFFFRYLKSYYRRKCIAIFKNFETLQKNIYVQYVKHS